MSPYLDAEFKMAVGLFLTLERMDPDMPSQYLTDWAMPGVLRVRPISILLDVHLHIELNT